MMRSLYSGVSGLRAHQTRMDVISNNVANVNTNGFKYSRVTFAETFAQTIKSAVSPNAGGGGSNPQQVGLGTQVASIDTIFSQGSLSQTGRVTDLAIQGNGFFVLSDKAGSGARAYGRDGNFVIDGEGYLVTASGGNVVQGWMADESGSINNARPLQNVKMPINGSVPAKATSELKIAGNFGSPSQLSEATAAANYFSDTPAIALAAPQTLTPGQLMINDISITGTINNAVPANSLNDLRQLADLINAKTSLTNVFATVKSTNLGPQLMLTSNRIGPLSEIKLDTNVPPAMLNALGISGTFPQTTTIYTQTTASGGAAPAGTVNMISGDIIVNGVDLGPMPATPATNTAEQNAQAVAALFNAKTGLTGVTAETDGAGVVSLKAAARDIILTGTAAGEAVTRFAVDPAVVATVGDDNRARTATTIAGTSMDFYDAQGAKHTMNINYAADYDTLRSGPLATDPVTGTRLQGNWAWAGFSADPNMIVNSQNDKGIQTEHILNFDNDGILKGFSNGQLTVSYINSNSTPPPQTLRLSPGTIATTDNSVTQFGGITSVDGNGQNGYASGELINFGIERNGTLAGIYTNGVNQPIAQLAMATFANPEGLYRSGDTSQVRGASNSFAESPNSGPARIGIANTGNRGEIRGGSLELSNVDLSMQFTDMIITQRGFQANSRSITTSDEMLTELVNLKR